MANNIPPFDASTGGVKGAGVNFLSTTSPVQWSPISVAGNKASASNTASPAAFVSKGSASLAATLLSAALGFFFTGGFGSMLSNVFGGISGGGAAKPFNFLETALAFFTGGKKSKQDV